jgi:hypothetical protein
MRLKLMEQSLTLPKQESITGERLSLDQAKQSEATLSGSEYKYNVS